MSLFIDVIILLISCVTVYGSGHLLIQLVKSSTHFTYNDPNNLLFWLLTVFIIYFYFNYLYFKYWSSKARNKRRRHTLYEKMNYSRLAKRNEAVKGLTRIDFNKSGINYDSFYYKREKLLLPLKTALNKYIGKINTRLDAIELFSNNNVRIKTKFYPLNQVRAGMPVVALENRMYCDSGDTHTLINGTTGSGKTFTIIYALIQVLAYTGESMVINDMKGELYRDTKEILESLGYDIKVISFLEPKCSDGWNPLNLAWREWKKEDERLKPLIENWKKESENLILQLRAAADANDNQKYQELFDTLTLHEEKKPTGDYSKAVEYIQDIAHTLCYDPDAKDPFWNGSAEDLIVGAFCLLCEVGNEEYINFKNIKSVITQGAEYVSKGKTYLSQYLDKIPLEKNSKQLLSSFANGAEATRNSQLQVFSQKLSFLTTNESVVNLTKKSDFNIEDLGKKKTVIFLQVHDEKKTFYSLLTLFVKQVYEVLINLSRENESLRLNVPVNLVLDEFGSMPPLNDLEAMLAAARSRGIRLTMIIQELAQLNKAYGDNVAKIIESNVSNLVYLLSGSPETQEFFSKASGTQLIWSKEKNQYEEKPVVSVDRLKSFDVGELLFIRQRRFAHISRMVGINKYVWYKKNKPARLSEKNHKGVALFDFKEFVKSYQVPHGNNVAQGKQNVLNDVATKSPQEDVNNSTTNKDTVENTNITKDIKLPNQGLEERKSKFVIDKETNDVTEFKLGLKQKLRSIQSTKRIGDG